MSDFNNDSLFCEIIIKETTTEGGVLTSFVNNIENIFPCYTAEFGPTILAAAVS